jgi:FAD/FMN-containing dehydrogenase
LPAAGDARIRRQHARGSGAAFRPATGDISAEAGLSLDELYRAFLPKGWFTPVTPGTRFVTLGGMVAADVHGKNHHVDGCFGRHVTAVRLRVADGRRDHLFPKRASRSLLATIGGMGLTGHILDVSFRLVRVPSPWIHQEIRRVPDIDAFMEALKTAAGSWPMTMGVDRLPLQGVVDGSRRTVQRALGRRTRGAEIISHAAGADSGSLHVSQRPCSTSTQPVRSTFAIYHQPHARVSVVHPRSFFYPLDVASDWHRGYGPRGFHAVSVRAAGIGRTRCGAPLPRGRDRLRRRVVPVRGSRTAGPRAKGSSPFPKKGDLDRTRPAHARRYAGADRSH